MEWKKVETNVWRPEKVDEQIEGILIDKGPSEQFPDNFTYTIKIIGVEGDINRIVYGTTTLNDRMASINKGDSVRIVFKGQKKFKRGEGYLWEVFKGN